MEKALIIVTITTLILMGIFLLIYIVYETPIRESEKMQYNNISLKVLDNNIQIRTGIIVTLDGSSEVYLNQNTTESNYLFFTVPKNRTFEVFTNNINNQSYYSSVYVGEQRTNNNLVLEIKLKKLHSINITKIGNLGTDNPINLTLRPNGTLQFLVLCVRWSENIVNVDVLGVQRGEPPKRLHNKVDRCFYIKEHIESLYSIPISYKTFGDLESKDYLEFFIIDGDIRYDLKTPDKYVIEDREFKDIGAKDIYYKIPSIIN